ETAMGSAISAFYDATPVIVPRSRFAPVKTSNDLLLTMSDCYLETEDATLVPNPECSTPLPLVNLDSKFYKKIDEFQKRFPEGVPSLLECRSLTVKGDVTFEPGVILRGEVRVENTSKSPVVLPAGTEVEGYVEL
ncbi:MAG TPA: UTP--glucose-1-phosphate uridylyltransferase, partial [Desulfomicrobiaceae bacterium]|nr:UTP--glucose-1-phosphate uridylyltransferase [Desulfomicrobiaceae bacterium]